MGGLFEQIQGKTQRQQNMIAALSKKAEGAVKFNEVSLDKAKAKSDKEKGIIVPAINYIDDEDSNAEPR